MIRRPLTSSLFPYTTLFRSVPPSVDLSILYAVIGEPPSFNGAAQEILICDKETNGVASPVGGFGTVAGLVVAEAELEGEPLSARLIGKTRWVLCLIYKKR